MNSPESKAAYVNSQTACALIKMEAMKSANKVSEITGQHPQYGEQDFMNIINEFGLSHNTVVGVLNQ